MEKSNKQFLSSLTRKSNAKRRLFFLLADSSLITLSLYTAFWLRFEGKIPEQYFPGFYYYLLLALVLKIGVLASFKVYNFSWGLFGLREAVRLVGAILVSYAVFSPAILLLRNRVIFDGFPRGVLLADFVLTLSLLCGLRISKRVFKELILMRSNGDRLSHKRTLIIGAGEAGVQICKEMLHNPKSEYLPVGYVDDDPAKKNLIIHGIKVLGQRNDIPRLIEKEKVEVVLIAIPSAESKEIRAIVDLIRKANKKVEIKILPGLLNLPGGSVSLTQIESIKPEDLLGREKVSVDYKLIGTLIKGKRILVSGAAGSIGEKIVSTCLRFEPQTLIALDIDETELFMLENNLKERKNGLKTVVADVRDRVKIKRVLEDFRPEILIHAAAYKHVPVMESWPEEAIKTNVYGTRVLAEVAMDYGVEKFVNISTDKAINPTSIMGASKRVAEELLRSFNQLGKTKFISVRFGNVLGSRGSVIPLFKEQIKRGGPVTVTHPDMKRYFMDITEAVLLVLEAAAIGEGGETFVLDMGEPVEIDHLAREMIRLSGKEPDVNIAIVYTGLRPGEKLFEEILGAEEGSEPTNVPKIFRARAEKINDFDIILNRVDKLIKMCSNGCPREEIMNILKEIVPSFNPVSYKIK